MSNRWISPLLAGLGLLAQVPSLAAGAPETLRVASVESPQDALLDVGISVFDPGIPARKLTKKELEQLGIWPELRKSEARFVPLALKDALEQSGFWGSVRVIPTGVGRHDVVVSGTLLSSNGKKLELLVRAEDSSGRRWFEQRYKGQADRAAYAEEPTVKEPFHGLYASIANDLLESLVRLKPNERRDLRAISALRFASELAPAAYGSYLDVSPAGRYKLLRAPAPEDSVYARVADVRMRDEMLADTLNEHYDEFRGRLVESYDGWRVNSYEEQRRLDSMRRSSALQTLLGGLAIIGAITMDGNDNAARTARDVMLMGGIAAIEGGLRKSGDIKMQKQELAELAQSFDAEAQPQVVEVENRTVKLTGSAEQQYASWRRLLGGLLAIDSGQAVDPNAAPATFAATPTTDATPLAAQDHHAAPAAPAAEGSGELR